MWTLPCRKMKEWDQNNLGKGTKINLPVIQQSVKGKTLLEAASCPPPVPSNSSCSRKAPRKMRGWPVHQKRTGSSGRKGIKPLASSSTLFMVLSIGPSLSNFSTSEFHPPPQENGCPPIYGLMTPSSRHLPTGTIRLGSEGRNTFLIPILHVLLMTGR